jgi:Xaa-Pro aminopeptidase
MSAKRINNLRQLIKKENLDGLIVTDLKQIRYLTGFSGSAALLAIGPKKALFFSDFRYKEQAAKGSEGSYRYRSGHNGAEGLPRTGRQKPKAGLRRGGHDG